MTSFVFRLIEAAFLLGAMPFVHNLLLPLNPGRVNKKRACKLRLSSLEEGAANRTHLFE